MTKEEFLKDVGNWSNHRYLLWPALEATKHLKLPVLELGCGDGSTPFLRKYCADNGLALRSFDSNKEWAKKMDVAHCPNWDTMEWFYKQRYSVVLVDESPGEHRKVSIELFLRYPEHAKILVVHDSEPKGWNASDYQVRPLFDRFKYVLDYESPKPGAWATAVSNFINVRKFEV
jgi:hypothetical protein